jgi:plastocyanin
MKKAYLLMLILGALALKAGADTIWVDVEDFYYEPHILYVPVGTTVTWTNYGPSHHTVTADDSSFYSGILLVGQSYSHTFNAEADVDYHCSIHPMMMGSIYVVTPSSRSALMVLNPVNPPIVIPPQGGTFQFFAQGTNNTNNFLSTQFWTKIYMSDMNNISGYSQDVGFNPMATRQATFTQSVPGTGPSGTYHFVGYVGTNPDCVLTWASFQFSKSGTAPGVTGWELTPTVDWHDVNKDGSSLRAEATHRLNLRNFPQPFNPSTTISYSLPQDGAVKLEVFNLAGARIASLVNGTETAGDHSVEFSPANMPSGMYLYRLDFGGQSLTNKMLFVK